MNLMSIEAKRAQVADQCKVVVHLANALAEVHRDSESGVRAGGLDTILDVIGRRTASIMEDIGDILNGMDAASEEDEWTYPIFEKAAMFLEPTP